MVPGPPLDLVERAPLEVARPEDEVVEGCQESGRGGYLRARRLVSSLEIVNVNWAAIASAKVS